MKQFKKPVRTCLSCRQPKDKTELLRIVKSNDGTISLDPGGKADGRGAYICRDRGCLEAARKGRKLSKAFKCAVGDEIYDKIALVIDG